MEKTYKFELPQSKEVESTNVRIEDGKVFVDVKFKERFQPKDGDFLVLGYKDKDGSCYWISIIKKFEKVDDITILTTDYVNYIFLADGNQSDCLNKIEFDVETSAAEEVRYATEKEKADFISRLEKEYGKRWNAEKKCLEDIYIPKFGDIVKVCINVEYDGMRDYMICIFPNKPLPTKSDGVFFDIANIGRSGELYYNCGYMCSNKIIHASESEKKELFDRLARVGKYWNEETKQLEDIRWRAEKGQFFHYVNGDLNILSLQDSRGKVSNGMYKAGNYFRITEAAKKVADQIKEIFKNSKTE